MQGDQQNRNDSNLLMFIKPCVPSTRIFVCNSKDYVGFSGGSKASSPFYRLAHAITFLPHWPFPLDVSPNWSIAQSILRWIRMKLQCICMDHLKI